MLKAVTRADDTITTPDGGRMVVVTRPAMTVNEYVTANDSAVFDWRMALPHPHTDTKENA